MPVHLDEAGGAAEWARHLLRDGAKNMRAKAVELERQGARNLLQRPANAYCASVYRRLAAELDEAVRQINPTRN